MRDICKSDRKSKGILEDADPVASVENKMKAVIQNRRQAFIHAKQGFIYLTPGHSATKKQLHKISSDRLKPVLEHQRGKLRATVSTPSKGSVALGKIQGHAISTSALKRETTGTICKMRKHIQTMCIELVMGGKYEDDLDFLVNGALFAFLMP